MPESLLCSPFYFGQYIYMIWLEIVSTHVGIPMGTSCVADLFLFSYERDFMLSFSDNNVADVIDASNAASRYLDDLTVLINLISSDMSDISH